MRVLVAYGSKRGATAGLAEMIASEFDQAGLPAAAKPARKVRNLDDVDAVVIAGSLYASRWHKDARRFARRHAETLRHRPVWLVSSGPLDDSATTRDISPVQHVCAAMVAIDARGQVTFGGRLDADARGFPASAIAKKNAGDWRDQAHVHRWVSAVAEELTHDGPTTQSN